MTSGNFNWLLHTMLFMHTQMVIKKQEDKERGTRGDEDEGDDDDDVGADANDDL
jgi:hypothetical protein